jgi:hypothetical protein
MEQAGALRENLNFLGEVIEETHPVEVPHGASFAFLEIETNSLCRGCELVRQRQETDRRIDRDFGALGKFEGDLVGIRVMRTTGAAQSRLEFRGIDPLTREAYEALHATNPSRDDLGRTSLY